MSSISQGDGAPVRISLEIGSEGRPYDIGFVRLVGTGVDLLADHLGEISLDLDAELLRVLRHVVHVLLCNTYKLLGHK